jgi:glycosyltransferase involved in cell wall biosynthesis
MIPATCSEHFLRGIQATKSAVVIAETKGAGDKFVITAIRPIPFQVRSGLEAMACGLPTIATAWSGPADFLSPSYAYTLRHSDPIPERARDGSVLRYHVEPELDHLIYQMRYVYEHKDEARAFGLRASNVIRTKWTWKQAAEKLAALFSLRPL